MKTLFISLLGLTLLASADERRDDGRGSLIDSDPAVVYVADLLPEQQLVELGVQQPAQVYATKTGGRKLGVLKVGKVKLIGFDDRAVKVQGQGQIGWVKPSVLVAEKGNIQELLKTVYSRQIEVQKLINEGEVALGMSKAEVCQVFGEPTKKTVRRTKEGTESTFEFIEYDEVDHFEPLVNFQTGEIFQRFTHTTTEEKSKTKVEFVNDVATAIEESDNDTSDRRVVVSPFFWF